MTGDEVRDGVPLTNGKLILGKVVYYPPVSAHVLQDQLDVPLFPDADAMKHDLVDYLDAVHDCLMAPVMTIPMESQKEILRART